MLTNDEKKYQKCASCVISNPNYMHMYNLTPKHCACKYDIKKSRQYQIPLTISHEDKSHLKPTCFIENLHDLMKYKECSNILIGGKSRSRKGGRKSRRSRSRRRSKKRSKR